MINKTILSRKLTSQLPYRRMNHSVVIPHLLARLQSLEAKVKQLSQPLPQFEYVLRVNGQEVWAGTDLTTHYPKMIQQYPQSTVSIGWRSSSVVLI